MAEMAFIACAVMSFIAGITDVMGLLTRPPSRGRERQLERRGAMLNATCRLVVRQRSVAMDPWILDPQTAGETQNFLESTPLSFLRAGPPKFRRISAESRAHPNFDKNFAKLRHRPTCCPCSWSRRSPRSAMSVTFVRYIRLRAGAR